MLKSLVLTHRRDHRGLGETMAPGALGPVEGPHLSSEGGEAGALLGGVGMGTWEWIDEVHSRHEAKLCVSFM